MKLPEWPYEDEPFHAGEQAAQALHGVRQRLAEVGRRVIRAQMPLQHRELFRQLPFIALAGVDGRGLPQATLLAGGGPGFVSSPDPTTLRVEALPAPEDPIAPVLAVDAPSACSGSSCPHGAAIAPTAWSRRSRRRVLRCGSGKASAIARSTYRRANCSPGRHKPSAQMQRRVAPTGSMRRHALWCGRPTHSSSQPTRRAIVPTAAATYRIAAAGRDSFTSATTIGPWFGPNSQATCISIRWAICCCSRTRPSWCQALNAGTCCTCRPMRNRMGRARRRSVRRSAALVRMRVDQVLLRPAAWPLRLAPGRALALASGNRALGIGKRRHRRNGGQCARRNRGQGARNGVPAGRFAKKAMAQRFDAIIIGSGQAGPALAGRLTGAGMSVAFAEREHFGGTCVNDGCTPTKALVASAQAAFGRAAPCGFRRDRRRTGRHRYAGGQGAQGTRSSRPQSTAWPSGSAICAGCAWSGDMRASAPRTGSSWAARIWKPKGSSSMSADGPWCPNGPAWIRPPFFTNTSMMGVDSCPNTWSSSAAVTVGLEFAQMYRRFGARVTVIEQAPRLIAREDEDVSEALQDILAREGIEFRLNARCIGASPREGGIVVSADCAEGPPEIFGTHLLLAVGRRPNTEDLGLDAAGIECDERGFIKVETSCARTCGRLGPGRRQRAWGLHSHVLERLRDRGGESARQRPAPRDRPHRRLRALHRSSAGAGRHQRARGAGQWRPPGSDRKNADDPGRPGPASAARRGFHEGDRR